MGRLVLDTCALVWATTDAAQLSSESSKLLSSPATECVVPSICFWEISLKVQRGLLDLGIAPGRLLARLRKQENVLIRDITPELWLASTELDWEHRDPADRVIVATAMEEELTLLTRDQRILAFYPHAVRA